MEKKIKLDFDEKLEKRKAYFREYYRKNLKKKCSKPKKQKNKYGFSIRYGHFIVRFD